MNIKKTLKRLLVQSNPNVRREYEKYKQDHNTNKRDPRVWAQLLKLNLQYRVLGRKGDGGRAMPYTDGPESEAAGRSMPLHVVSQMVAYEVISFDIFDTLLLRPFAKPVDLFFMVERRLGLYNFYNIRIQAEAEARAAAEEATGSREVTLLDIYRLIERRTGLDAETGARAEFETEKEFCFANPYMLRVFDGIRRQGKRIIAISDMYLPADWLRELLEAKGYTGIAEIYVSCERGCSKRDGGLYRLVMEKEGPAETLCHIGDNWDSDILVAREMQINAIFYQNVNIAGGRYRADGMSEIVGSAYAGVVNAFLHNGLHAYSPHFEHGFIYGGLYVMGFCRFLHEQARRQGIDKILFLSRDGMIYQRVFQRLYGDIPTEYYYWSRIANTRLGADTNRGDFLKRFVSDKAHSVVPQTVGAALSAVYMGDDAQGLAGFDLRAEDILTEENAPAVEDYLLSRWDEVLRRNQAGMEASRQEAVRAIGDSRHVAIVDVGWTGVGPMSLKELIEKRWQLGCRATCFIAGLRDTQNVAAINWLQEEKVQPYLFSKLFNRNLYHVHFTGNKRTNSIYFELFTQACHPSFEGFDAEGRYQFATPEVENYGMIREIHAGIEAFCEEYLRHFSAYPDMLNVGGSDAYMPFVTMVRSRPYIRRLFGDFSYARSVGGGEEQARIETVGEIMDKLDL